MSETLNKLKNREDTWNSKILSHLILMNRINRPDEWTMDDFARMALSLENSYSEAAIERDDAIQASLMDITRAEKAEARVKELEDNLRILVDLAHEGAEIAVGARLGRLDDWYCMLHVRIQQAKSCLEESCIRCRYYRAGQAQSCLHEQSNRGDDPLGLTARGMRQKGGPCGEMARLFDPIRKEKGDE